MLSSPKSTRQVDADKALDWVQKTYSIRLAEKQAEAVRNALIDKILVIVDEMSMVDTVLIHRLLKAVRLDTTLIMVGDVNQLPSVDAGNVLKDIIASGAVPVVELREIFRQARESSIIVNAHLINQGQFPRLTPRQDKLDNFFFMQEEDPEKVLEKIKYIVMQRIPKRFQLNPVTDVQVISPMNKGVVGVSNLNTHGAAKNLGFGWQSPRIPEHDSGQS